MFTPFRDRTEAGRYLAEKLIAYADRREVLVLALPRGGVPVGYEIAWTLNVPLDAFVVRKLGVPGHEEPAMGAIGSGGVIVLYDEVVRSMHPSFTLIESVATREFDELERRERDYRGGRPALDVRGHTVILVDEGLATGSIMRAAVKVLHRLGPARIVVAVPTAAPSAGAAIGREVDECICSIAPDPFHAVGDWYEDSSQTTDDEVRDLLERADGRPMVPA